MTSCVTGPLVLLTCLLVTSVRARFKLMADFVTYNNALHAYWNPESGNGTCCGGGYFPNNCSDPCNTLLRYCFKNYGTDNNISNDKNITFDCLEGTSSGFLTPTDYIDYSMPPSTTSGTTTRSSLMFLNNSWPGQMQFFVWSVRQRSSTAVDVIDYLVLDFTLAVGENLTDQIINGRFFGSDVTFTVSLSLSCFTNFYGPDCSTYCHPANSSEMGHYTCLSDGSKQCLPGYQNEATYCTSCVPAVGCHSEYGYCNAPGECKCLPGYGGDLCHQDMDVCGRTSPCQAPELCTNAGPDSYKCTGIPTIATTPSEPIPTIATTSSGPIPTIATPSGPIPIATPSEPIPIATPSEPIPTIATPSEPIPTITTTPSGPIPTITTTPSGPIPTITASPSEPSTTDSGSSSVVPLAAGVAGGSVLLLILLCVLALLAVVALKKRMYVQTVDLEGDSDKKPVARSSYQYESGVGLLDNPVYEAAMQGTHLPLGKSPSVEVDAEYDVENPLYMMGVQGQSTIPFHDYDYATTDNISPPTSIKSKAPPPLAGEGDGQVYTEPDIGHPLSPPPGQSTDNAAPFHDYDYATTDNIAPPTSFNSRALRPSASEEDRQVYAEPDIGHLPPAPPPPQDTHKYSEPDTGTSQAPTGPIYDAPIMPEKRGVPINLDDHYETADNVTGTSRPLGSTIYDIDEGGI